MTRASDLASARYYAAKQAEAASIVEERNRMAREIHDTLAQAFTGILLQVGGNSSSRRGYRSHRSAFRHD